jgi:adducin
MQLLVKVYSNYNFKIKISTKKYIGPVLPVNDIRGIDSRSYVKNERYLRCKLASLYRVIDLYGWNYGTCYNHVSVRINKKIKKII